MRIAFFAALAAIIALVALVLSVFLPRPDGPPPLRATDRYLTTVVRAVFNGPVDDVIAHLQSEDGGVLAFVERTDRIPEIVGFVPIESTFPNEGAVRMVQLADGSTVTERVLENSAETFAYQIWAFTSPTSRPIDHIRGSFTYNDLGGGSTEVVWTYEVAPRIFWAAPFIQGFLDNDFGPFMESGLNGSAFAFNQRLAN